MRSKTKHPARSALRVGSRGEKTGGVEIGIHKLSALCQCWQVLQSEGGFARAVGSGNQMANGCARCWFHCPNPENIKLSLL